MGHQQENGVGVGNIHGSKATTINGYNSYEITLYDGRRKLGAEAEGYRSADRI